MRNEGNIISKSTPDLDEVWGGEDTILSIRKGRK